uniref:Uncharacterized protein n=1 Tax=Rhizophora mucronata TaxID=61149 RepID=A0A2P2JCL3_RHIMU
MQTESCFLLINDMKTAKHLMKNKKTREVRRKKKNCGGGGERRIDIVTIT